MCVIGQNRLGTLSLIVKLKLREFSLIHCDLWEPYPTRAMSGCYYFLYVVDDFTRAIWVYLLKDKSEACEKLINFCTMVKTQFDITVQRIQSDNERSIESVFSHIRDTSRNLLRRYASTKWACKKEKSASP